MSSRTGAVAFRVLGARAQLLGTGDSDALQNVNTTEFPDGALCWVQDQASFYVLHKNSTAAPSGTVIVQPGAGPGRWFQLVTGSGDEQIIVPNLAALAALAAPANGESAYVLTLRSAFVFRSASALSADDITIVDADDATGQWLRTNVPDLSWAAQSDWYINPTTGDDEATGAVGQPLQTAGELMRRINGQTLTNAATTVHQLGTLPEYVDLDVILPDPAGRFFWFGDASAITTLHAGTFSAVTALNAAANTPNAVTDGSIGDWATAGPGGTSLIGHRIRMTAGAQSGATAGLLKRVSATQARTGPWIKFDPINSTTLGDSSDIHVDPTLNTYVVEQLPGIRGLRIRARRFDGSLTNQGSVVVDSIEIGTGLAAAQSTAIFQVDQFVALAVISRCRFLTSRIFNQMMRSLYCISCVMPQTFSFCGQVTSVGNAIIGSCLQLNGSLVRFYNYTTIQSGFVSVRQPTSVAFGLGIFDATSSSFGGLHVDYDNYGRLELGASTSVYGSGNAGPGIDINGGCLIAHGGTLPTITGSNPGVNDLRLGQIGTTNYSWAAVAAAPNKSVYDATRAMGIVQI